MIKDGDKVTIAFQLKDEDQEVWDEASMEEPFTYVHGKKQLMQIVEKELTGHSVGDKLSIEIPPAQAYGDVDARLKKALPRTHFAQVPDLQVGMELSLSEDSHMNFKIVGFDDNEVIVDANHPLAGKTLTFEIEVLNVQA